MTLYVPIEMRGMKVPLFESIVKIQTWFRECKRRRIIHEIRHVTEFSLLLKNPLIKTMTVLVNRNHFAVKLLHWHEQEIY